jgi:hypothetical protein
MQTLEEVIRAGMMANITEQRRESMARAGATAVRAFLGSDEVVEAMCKAHCDHFGGEGWWETGLLKDTLPEAHKAMRAALSSIVEVKDA